LGARHDWKKGLRLMWTGLVVGILSQPWAPRPWPSAGRPATVFVAADDEAARAAVVDLARSAGFDTLETGALATARYLEPVAALNITLGYGLGHGTDIAPTWQRAA